MYAWGGIKLLHGLAGTPYGEPFFCTERLNRARKGLVTPILR